MKEKKERKYYVLKSLLFSLEGWIWIRSGTGSEFSQKPGSESGFDES
jgi:hypothetical protein